MDDYFRSGPGRLLAFALSIPMVTGAVLPWNADNVGSYTVPVIGAIALAVIAVGMSIDDYPGHAIIAMLFLPVALFLYIPLVGLLVPSVHAMTYVLAAAALALISMSVRPSLPDYRRLGVSIRGPAHHQH